MVGSGIRSVSQTVSLLLVVLAMAPVGTGFAQALYKYRGDNGEWIYTDRAPEHEIPAEVRTLKKGSADPSVTVYQRSVNGRFALFASNEYFAPVEVILGLDELDNLNQPPAETRLRWVIPPRSRTQILQLSAVDSAAPVSADYRYIWLPGDPDSTHRPDEPYRAPFAIASGSNVSQAYPDGITHQTPDSYYAVDFVMPIGTDVHAARAGTVFEVASTNFQGGLDPNRNLQTANLIRILHEDGTFAVYAHLNWNTIRVQPGDRVERGEYIADSGNTGFSSGPHLHFAVIRNKGLRLESVPIVFEGRNDSEVTPETGSELVAY